MEGDFGDPEFGFELPAGGLWRCPANNSTSRQRPGVTSVCPVQRTSQLTALVLVWIQQVGIYYCFFKFYADGEDLGPWNNKAPIF